jgi:hypothetical protein
MARSEVDLWRGIFQADRNSLWDIAELVSASFRFWFRPEPRSPASFAAHAARRCEERAIRSSASLANARAAANDATRDAHAQRYVHSPASSPATTRCTSANAARRAREARWEVLPPLETAWAQQASRRENSFGESAADRHVAGPKCRPRKRGRVPKGKVLGQTKQASVAQLP